ncbi:E3 ubiquitin-protein ligase MIB2-like [Glandiceps talaboti]
MIDVGLRVVRGPDWKWGNQDDGEGHVGTLVEIGKAGSTASPDKTVVVQWDSGTRTNYRVGYQGAYDLLIYDNAPIGIKHPNIICDVCKKHGIQGMRWKCTECYDYDLCTECYMTDKHDSNHTFMRYVTQNSAGVKMPKRTGSAKVQARGIFPGGRVVRGPDWDWGSQDGGEGKTGRVTDIRGWDVESGKSVASVTWSNGSTNVYRVGHKGKVDIKYTQDAPGGPYYKDHLPKLGERLEMNPIAVSGETNKNTFNVGDKVKVVLEIELLKAMQEGHGGWNPKMADFVGKIGFVHRVTERGDIRVQYPGSGTRWTFHPGALAKVRARSKVDMFSIGDIVKITEDLETVKKLQAGHGEWTESMKATLGKNGKVLKVYTDGDLRVSVNGSTWTYNPSCASLVQVHGSKQDANNTMSADREDLETNSLSTLLDQLIISQSNSDSPDRIVGEAAQGNTSKVRDLVSKHPSKVDIKSSGKTALQVSSHQGHLDVVKVLLSAKATLELQDQDGDTALHYAIFGNAPEVAQLLLSKGAKVNAVNNAGCSCLHVAVNKSHIQCVRVLLRYNCNVNLQDSYGDTALHDAIAKANKEVIEMLIDGPGADFTLRNKRGFNVLHHAALKGNNFATEKLLIKARQLGDVKKDDGFTALHLAALNGHRDVAETLITKGQVEIDCRNNRYQTPLLLAVSQGHTSLIELLVSKGANVNVEDEDGDTCLHLALMRQTVSTVVDNSPMVAEIRSTLGMDDSDANTGTAIACYLVQEGANLEYRNHQRKTPLDIITDPRVEAVVKQYAENRRQREQQQVKQQHQQQQQQQRQQVDGKVNPRVHATTGNLAAIVHDCRMCSKPANCQFQPCGHMIACMHCASLFKKCYVCKLDVQGRKKIDVVEVDCLVCTEAVADVIFQPCGHKVACKDCATRMKKCISCQTTIIQKLGKDGTQLAGGITNALEVKEMQEKMRELEEAQLCTICMETKRNVVFLCGHGTCKKCAKPLKNCPMCRKPITKKINIFH